MIRSNQIFLFNRLCAGAFLLFAFSLTLSAAVPAQKRVPGYYDAFCKESPFTVLPPPPPPPPPNAPENVLGDWALSGVANIGGRKFVLVQNKKNPAERVTLVSGSSNDKNIEVLEIEYGKNYRDTRVKLRFPGNVEGWISYDPAALQITKPNVVGAPPAPAPGQPQPHAQAQAQPQPQPQPVVIQGTIVTPQQQQQGRSSRDRGQRGDRGNGGRGGR